MIGNIRLDVFQGPLDLLLTLIERQEIDARAIPVTEVAAQYLEYLHQVEELDLEWAGEFIVLGAELLALKARLLLQRPKEEEQGAVEGEDPAQALAERLLTYRLYKKAAVQLEELAARGALVFGRSLDQEAITRALAAINPITGITPLDLAQSLARTLSRSKIKKQEISQTIKRPVITLASQVHRIWRRLYQEDVLNLDSLLSSAPTRLEVVLTVLALLELASKGRVNLSQEETFGVIKVRRLEGPGKGKGN